MKLFCKSFHDISHISQNGLEKLFYNNKMSTYAELMQFLKANEIRCYPHYTKSKLIDWLVKRGLTPEKNRIKINKKKLRRILILNIIFYGRYAAIQRRLRNMIWKQIRLFFMLLYTRLLWPWIKTPGYRSEFSVT